MGRHRNIEQPQAPRYCEICGIEIPKVKLCSWSSYNKRETCSRKHKGELSAMRAAKTRQENYSEGFSHRELESVLNDEAWRKLFREVGDMPISKDLYDYEN